VEDSLLSCGGVRGEVVRALKTLLFGRSSQAMGKGGWYPLSFLDSRGCFMEVVHAKRFEGCSIFL
jgi:hypothetical protein